MSKRGALHTIDGGASHVKPGVGDRGIESSKCKGPGVGVLKQRGSMEADMAESGE